MRRLPSPDAYRAAIQHPDFAFSGNSELAQTKPKVDRFGIPITYSGNFTATFHLEGETSAWAVRCYRREIKCVADRYQAITRFLGDLLPELGPFAMARLVPGGIVVGGDRYDIIQMEWITGTLLNEHVDLLIEGGNTSELEDLAEAVLDLGLWLEKLGIAHGDIQHGNVLVDTSGRLRLVDYDDMFLPALAHLGFPGLGEENYQHPKRGSGHYDATLDRFPFISIYVSLCALAANPQLRGEGDEDCLLFRKADFLDPYESELFRKLDSIDRIKAFVDGFSSICVGAYEDIPSLTDFVAGRFHYTRFAPKAATTQAAQLRPDTHPVGFIPDATPVPVRAVSSYPTPATEVVRPSRPGLVFAIIGGASVLAIIGALLGLLGHRSYPVASLRNFTPPTARSRTVIRAPAPRVASHQHARQVASVPRANAARQATSTPAPQRIATPTPRAVAAAKAARANVAAAAPEAARKMALRHTAPPPPVRAAAILEAAKSLPSAASVAGPEPRNACSTPDAPAHLVSLAAPEISSEKRAESAGKSVTVTVNLGADGSVTDASVKDSAGDVALDFAALGVARHSTYVPAEANCNRAAGTVDVTVTY